MMLRRKKKKRKKKGIRMTLVGRAVIDEATIEGESGSDDRFYDARSRGRRTGDETQRHGDPKLHLDSAKDREHCGVDPSGPTSEEAEFTKFEAKFERKRANRFHDDLEKAKRENAGLLAYSLSPDQTQSLDFLT
ncbi:hypothetical protein Dimus_010928 [Dionaea muscipula]